MTIQPEQKMSIARRRLLLASSAVALLPALGLAASAAAATPAEDRPLSSKSVDQFILSGRIVGAQAAPLCGQTIAMLGGGTALATTDGDGRFVLVINAPAHFDPIFLKVGDRQTKRIELTRDTAQLARDGDGVWRAAVAISMA